MKVALGLGLACLYLVAVVLTSASQIRVQTSVVPRILTSTTAPLDLKDLGSDGQTIQTVTDSSETTAEVTAFSSTEESTTDTTTTPVYTTHAGAVPSSTASESPVDTQTSLGSLTTQSSAHTFSSQPASTFLGGTSIVLFSITAPAQTTTGGSQGIMRPTHQEIPSQLNVGSEDFKGNGHSSLDPLLAGLLSMFIVTTAVIFVVLFLKFRHQNSNPEFHRLQDLPMSQR
ncbi:uncharacterized protein LOC129412565 [Boleophthalmus pectinirostris]|uniref:uncharacterized protein LOC129412565 n=1 Tax=Boleophthalmus pectinirostris TaxID=150288 RepID=UPI00242AB613|nr:uncharacterized protein LOC129412565 [Boleophthalmus pectinirostris]